MKRFFQIMAILAGLVLLVILGVGTWFWSTIPATPDPDTIPSNVAAGNAGLGPESLERIQRLAREAISEEKLPGLSVAVGHRSEVVWAEAFRWANVETQELATPRTRYRIGPISEVLTAVAIAKLAENGHLDLDQPIQNYLPDFPEKIWPIHTRHLLSHTSGIRSGDGFVGQRNCQDDASRLRRFEKRILKFEPGTAFARSNYGIILAGAIVGGAAGGEYSDYVQGEILDPLELASFGVDGPGHAEAEAAKPYFPRAALNPALGLQDLSVDDLSCNLPSGGFLAAPTDLVELGLDLLAGEILQPATLEEFWMPAQLVDGREIAHGLGFQLGTVELGDRELRVVGQGLGQVVLRRPLSAISVGGQVPGSTTTLWILPDAELVIAVMTNVSGSNGVAKLAEDLARVVLETRP